MKNLFLFSTLLIISSAVYGGKPVEKAWLNEKLLEACYAADPADVSLYLQNGADAVGSENPYMSFPTPLQKVCQSVSDDEFTKKEERILMTSNEIKDARAHILEARGQNALATLRVLKPNLPQAHIDTHFAYFCNDLASGHPYTRIAAQNAINLLLASGVKVPQSALMTTGFKRYTLTPEQSVIWRSLTLVPASNSEYACQNLKAMIIEDAISTMPEQATQLIAGYAADTPAEFGQKRKELQQFKENYLDRMIEDQDTINLRKNQQRQNQAISDAMGSVSGFLK